MQTSSLCPFCTPGRNKCSRVGRGWLEILLAEYQSIGVYKENIQQSAFIYLLYTNVKHKNIHIFTFSNIRTWEAVPHSPLSKHFKFTFYIAFLSTSYTSLTSYLNNSVT